MRAKNKNIYAWREQAIIREIATHDLYLLLAVTVRSFAQMPLRISYRNRAKTKRLSNWLRSHHSHDLEQIQLEVSGEV